VIFWLYLATPEVGLPAINDGHSAAISGTPGCWRQVMGRDEKCDNTLLLFSTFFKKKI